MIKAPIPPSPTLYNFDYPKSLVANKPTKNRVDAKLLVYDTTTKKTYFDTFKNLAKYLPPHAVLVLNNTKVIPARFYATKVTGGRVELLYLSFNGNEFVALANRALQIGEVLRVFGKQKITVTKKLVKGYKFIASFPLTSLYKLLDKYGVTPIPPYIKNTKLSESKLRTEYQTVFSKTKGSSAAPTASLHLSKELIAELKQQGHKVEFITLHVGLGTFAPLTEMQLVSRKLHTEWYKIFESVARRLNKYKKQGRPIVAVGTTVVRTLESASNSKGELEKLSGDTSLFIYHPYNLKFVSLLITNFHVPKSSLLMLVASITGRKKLLELYKLAIQKKFRLFSFGDGMLII